MLHTQTEDEEEKTKDKGISLQLTFCMHPTNEPSSLRFNGKYCALFDPPKYKLCGNDKCQKPFGDTIIISESWLI